MLEECNIFLSGGNATHLPPYMKDGDRSEYSQNAKH
jgi:hypothetical protein|nr:MAG: hypothetical protein [Bacteriophage sp.]DAZ80675.1 MAG TPA: hypothetical protein [Caudoviricetes sp.]